jgi:hypothetical protein
MVRRKKVDVQPKLLRGIERAAGERVIDGLPLTPRIRLSRGQRLERARTMRRQANRPPANIVQPAL